jgi:serine/threonine protein kinase
VCQATDYMHKNDVIHRDLKPENILMHEVYI